MLLLLVWEGRRRWWWMNLVATCCCSWMVMLVAVLHQLHLHLQPDLLLLQAQLLLLQVQLLLPQLQQLQAHTTARPQMLRVLLQLLLQPSRVCGRNCTVAWLRGCKVLAVLLLLVLVVQQQYLSNLGCEHQVRQLLAWLRLLLHVHQNRKR